MSSTMIAHKCVCVSPKLGTVDGDTETVYCDNCDGALGNVADMVIVKSIEVKSPFSFGEDISVVIDDECNHAGAEIEMIEYAKPSWYADAHCFAMDDSEELPTLVCKCGFEEVQEREEPDYD